MKKNKLVNLQKKANWIRNKVLDMAVRAGAGHIAPSFSCIEILTALYYCGILKIKPKKSNWQNRDRFILSKGHATVALYAILADLGFFPLAELNNFTQAGSRLGGHAENHVPGMEAFTGSLGHGLSIGAGIALAAKMDRKKFQAVVLLGDGECHEGTIWEAAMFAAQHGLDNLTAIIDHNGLSATDFLKNYLAVEPLKNKWEAFGWQVVIVRGHNFEDLLRCFSKIHSRKSKKPLAIIALTTKGKGVSFMENCPIWHYRVPRGEELKLAKQELSFNYKKES